MSRSAKILLILLAAGLLCFGALEGAVLAGCHDEVTHDADVVIVLVGGDNVIQPPKAQLTDVVYHPVSVN